MRPGSFEKFFVLTTSNYVRKNSNLNLKQLNTGFQNCSVWGKWSGATVVYPCIEQWIRNDVSFLNDEQLLAAAKNASVGHFRRFPAIYDFPGVRPSTLVCFDIYHCYHNFILDDVIPYIKSVLNPTQLDIAHQ